MTYIIAFAFLISILVFVHELGHYLAARSIGVKVERFSVGFPPRLGTFTSVPGGWKVNLFFFKKDEKGFVYPLDITKRIEEDFKTFITPEWREELFNLE